MEVNTDLDNGSEQYKIEFKIYKLFKGVAHTTTVVGYDIRNKTYHITYKDGHEEHLFCNEVHACKDKINPCEIKKKL